MGKHVATLATGGSRDAQKYLHFAFDQINLGTQRRTVMYISGMAASGVAPDYAEALGDRAMTFMQSMDDIGNHALGVYLMKQPTEEMRAKLSIYIQNGVKNGTLLEEEAFEIEDEPNIYRAIRLMKKYRQDKIKARQADEQRMAEIQMQTNTQSVQAAEGEKRTTLEMEVEGKTRLAWEQAKAEVWKAKQTIADEAFMLNLKTKLATNQALTEEEQRRLTELAKEDTKGMYGIQIAQINARKAESSKADRKN
jgi:hypothetical protein